MMPGAAYATPHSTERDGHLHFVAPVAPPKRALRFFSHCGLAATRAPESSRSDLLYDDVMRMGRKMRALRVDSGAVSVDRDDHHARSIE
jgi:hypothetical protein